MKFGTPDFKHIGNYRVKVEATLDNSLATTSETTFSLEVVPGSDGSSFAPEPELKLILDELKVKLGESLSYTIEFSSDQDDFTMKSIELDMSSIKRFASFASELATLFIDGERTTDGDVNMYLVEVLATFTNGTYTTTVQDLLSLTIVPQDAPIRPPPRPIEPTKEVKEYSWEEWDGDIRFKSE